MVVGTVNLAFALKLLSDQWQRAEHICVALATRTKELLSSAEGRCFVTLQIIAAHPVSTGSICSSGCNHYMVSGPPWSAGFKPVRAFLLNLAKDAEWTQAASAPVAKAFSHFEVIADIAWI